MATRSPEERFLEFVSHELTEIPHPYSMSMAAHQVDDPAMVAELLMHVLKYDYGSSKYKGIADTFLSSFDEYTSASAADTGKRISNLKTILTSFEPFIKKVAQLLGCPDSTVERTTAWRLLGPVALDVIPSSMVSALTQNERRENIGYWERQEVGGALLYRTRMSRNSLSHEAPKLISPDVELRFFSALGAYLYVTEKLAGRLARAVGYRTREQTEVQHTLDYCVSLAKRLELIKVRGSGVQVPISDIYVDNTPPGFGIDRVSPGTIVAILGPQGSGKSTLLRHLAITLAQRYLSSPGTSALPFLVRLPDYWEGIQQASDLELKGFLTKQWALCTGANPVDVIRAVGALLQKGRCFVLLDAYDEVPTGGEAVRVAKRIEAFADEALKNGNRLLIASRERAFAQTRLVADIARYDLPVLTSSQQKQFLDLWCTALEQREAVRQTRVPDLRVAATRVSMIVSAAARNSGIGVMASNPLALRLLAQVSQDTSVPLPDNRWELFGRAAKFLAEDWQIEDKERSKRDLVTFPIIEEVLANTAARLKLGVTLTREDLVNLISDMWSDKSKSLEAMEKADTIATHLFRVGLVDLSSSRVVLLPPFDDYYAARWLISDIKTVESKLLAIKHKAQWHEALLLALHQLHGIFGPNESAALVKRFISAHPNNEAMKADGVLHANLLLGASCVIDGVQVDKASATTILESLIELWVQANGTGRYVPLRNQIRQLFRQAPQPIAMRLSGMLAERLVDLESDVLPAAIDGYVSLPIPKASILSAVESYIHHPDELVKAAAIQVLSQRGLISPDRIAWLLTQLHRRAPRDLQLAIIGALACHTDPDDDVVQALFRCLKWPDGQISGQAAIALGTLAVGSTKVRQMLADNLRHKHSAIRVGVLIALARMPSIDAELLRRIGSIAEVDPHLVVRRKAVSCLSKNLQHPYAVDVLSRVLTNDSSERVRSSCARSMGRIAQLPEPAIKALRQALQDSNAAVRENAKRTLWQHGLFNDSDARVSEQPLVLVASDRRQVPNLRAQAVAQLADLPSVSDGAYQLLTRIAIDATENPNVRSTAITALARAPRELPFDVLASLKGAFRSNTNSDVAVSASANIKSLVTRVSCVTTQLSVRSKLVDWLIALLNDPDLSPTRYMQGYNTACPADAIFTALAWCAQVDADERPVAILGWLHSPHTSA